MKTRAQEAYYKFATLMKTVEGPWSKESPHDIAAIKLAIYQFRRNTLQKPKRDPWLSAVDITGSGGASSTETSFPTTEAFPWDNKSLDNMTRTGDNIS